MAFCPTGDSGAISVSLFKTTAFLYPNMQDLDIASWQPYEFRDLLSITHPSTEIIGKKLNCIVLDHILFSGLSLVLKKQQFALGRTVHGCDTHLL